jgi:tRNA-Thr(GGU) m(6)t(6)A37 methyltransferase TsaA
MEIVYKPIGIIHSPFTEKDQTPIQSAFSKADGTVEVFPEYSEGLRDIEGFSHLILIYHFHHTEECSLTRKPFLDGSRDRGIFAIRHFCRPNPIGISVVELKKVRGNILEVGGIDVLDGTPLLDIKPYVRQFDCRDESRNGWVDVRNPQQEEADRYTPGKLRQG